MTKSHAPLLIREAVVADAIAILQTHFDAVHISAADDYAPAILDDWSAPVEARLPAMQDQIRINSDQTFMLVAELDGAIVGFGEIAACQNELRAVYVSPSAGRTGVGHALLTELESKAHELGVEKLWLDSSLTAEPFYKAHGYVRDSEGEHQLRSGRTMTCIHMHKQLL